jgi:hypothetical protein
LSISFFLFLFQGLLLYRVQAGFVLMMVLPQPPNSWDYRYVPYTLFIISFLITSFCLIYCGGIYSESNKTEKSKLNSKIWFLFLVAFSILILLIPKLLTDCIGCWWATLGSGVWPFGEAVSTPWC